MAQLYTIQSVGESTALDQTGRVVRTTQVKYMVGNDGPFTLIVPPDKNTPPQIAALLAAKAKDVMDIRGV